MNRENLEAEIKRLEGQISLATLSPHDQSRLVAAYPSSGPYCASSELELYVSALESVVYSR